MKVDNPSKDAVTIPETQEVLFHKVSYKILMAFFIKFVPDFFVVREFLVLSFDLSRAQISLITIYTCLYKELI